MGFAKISGWLVPQLCAGCRGHCPAGPLICGDCLWDLDEAGPVPGDPPEGVSRIMSVAPHEGIGRDLLAAYKFRGLYGLGEFLAARMADVTPGNQGSPRTVVPVPPARGRSRLRGYDTAGDLGARLAGHLGWPYDPETMIRIGSGRQRGRGRSSRIGNPPEIRSTGQPANEILLVDDVITTGATLSACALTLREAGAGRIEAVTFTRRV